MAFRFQHRIAAAAVLAALALPTLAQTASTATTAPASTNATVPDAGPQRHKAGERHHGDRAQKAQKRAEHRAQREAAFKQKLNLTAAQEPAWSTYTAAMQPGERPARLDFQGMDKLTTPERIDRMRALRAQHAAEADRRGEATKAFYAALSPEQQKTFDAQAHKGPRHHARHGMKHQGDGEGRHGRPGHPGARTAPAAPAAPAQ